MNSCNFVGRLTHDPELEVKKEKKLCKFQLACPQYPYKDQFLNFITRGQTAENFVKYCEKGQEIAVQGILQVYVAQSEKGRKYFAEITVTSIEYLSKSKKREYQKKEEDDDDDFFEEVGDKRIPF